MAAHESFPINMVDLYVTLALFPSDMAVMVATPKGDERGVLLHSWRGIYEEPAFAVGRGATTVGELKETLLAALDGQTHTGWKGGEFVLDRNAPIRLVSAEGVAQEGFVVGVALHEGRLWLQGNGD